MASPTSPTGGAGLGQTIRKTQKELTEAQISEIKNAFDLFDVDDSGSIDRRELLTAMKALGCDATQEEIEHMIGAADDDFGVEEGAGEIEFDEFLLLMKGKMLEATPQDTMTRAFGLIDKKKTGKLTFDTLKDAMRDLGDKTPDEEIHEIIDLLGDNGAIPLEEFLRIMKKNKLC
mmetsp:Transcript_103367/g.205466  ORF Transcript_103367/g.205466 Transcript_103367/m.205466 type:complete len:175 (+) Transcript_103367:46-570(+)|eukprot:CAMPEP_0172698920 /NCGR_PEP_ID=MMETSP1074-20121228/29808_1 /TAXON_ID=2916 /ORGANISM="Ceratium fusus, Strain PA161109" /LENGTH=174 /DNA_ID=CAMNT_0013520029 /DNA_START=40 /DNA_END=564 /DNA_ORIENTATION=-